MNAYTQQDLKNMIQEAHDKVVIGGRYSHYKNPEHTYIVLDVVMIEATETPAVVFRAEYGENIKWVRPVTEFLEALDLDDGTKKPRYTKLEEQAAAAAAAAEESSE